MVVKRGIKQVFFCPISTVYIADRLHCLYMFSILVNHYAFLIPNVRDFKEMVRNLDVLVSETDDVICNYSMNFTLL